MARKPRLTDKTVKALEAPTKGSRITYCGDVSGFGVRITAKGAIAFVLNYVSAGRERRITIGDYPTWSVAAAREQAQRFKRDVDLGGDPVADRNRLKNAPTFLDLWNRYDSEHLPKRSSGGRKQEKRLWEMYVFPILGKHRAISTVEPSDIEALMAETKKRVAARRSKRPKSQWDSSQAGAGQARAVAVSLKVAFNLACKKWRWINFNPVSGVKLGSPPGRERFLSEVEIARVIAALNERDTVANLCLKFLLLTGARKGETMQARWDEFALAAGSTPTWRKPSHHTKVKRDHLVPLSPEAVAVLTRLRSMYPKSEHVFPGQKRGSHITELKMAWQAACATAKIEGVRIHDLRHTYASLLASQNLSLPLIGKLLGHTQQSTTHRYAHLSLESLTAATMLVGSITSKAAAE